MPSLRTLGMILASATLAVSAVAGDTIEVACDEPDADRWNYPFNASPGTRASASIFGNWNQYGESFDNRDAQMAIGFDTALSLPPGSVDGYRLERAVVRVQLSNEGIVYDATVDPVECFLATDDPDWIEDVDAGQPIELYGTGFRNGMTAGTWTESSAFAYGDPMLPGVRNAFALSFESGVGQDISNHLRERWTPTPFAVATIKNVAEGAVIPLDTVIEFEFNLDDADVRAYVRAGLDTGRLLLTISSMTAVEVQGGTYPLFYCKENLAVEYELASAATFEAVLVPDDGVVGDINGDGNVDGADLTMLLGSWGSDDAAADLDDDGLVDGGDLTMLLGNWT